MEYKLIKSSRGIRYMKGAKFCSVKDIPEDVLQRLHEEKTVDTAKNCPFCNRPGTEEKTLNSTRYYLCEDDYRSKTTGELAAAVRTMDI